ncbi:MAG: imidazolonepropionase-like amidohydrolase [Planctomycetota bacterium]|jgi:imidazolonepropionase-like amidohydrolase
MRTLLLTLLIGAGLAFGAGSEAPAEQALVILGDKVYTMAGAALVDGAVVCVDGKIVSVGPSSEITIPEGARVIRAKVVTPGLVDAHSVVGLSGYLNQPHDQDQIEGSAPLQPELRAIDAYNPREALVAWLRGFGVTTVHTGHAPGAVISGQTLIAKTVGDTVEQSVIVPFAMVAATVGEGATSGESPAPGTRAKAIALLRQELISAGEYAADMAAGGDQAPARNLRKEALAAVLAGERKLLITAHRAHDIAAALRVAAEFELSMVLDGGAEAYLMIDELRAADVPVIVHAPMLRASGETKGLSMETPHLLQEAGLLVGLQSGLENYVPKTRVVLFEAAIAARYGCSFEDALRMVTLDAARIIGVDQRVGSLEPGKDADLALYDGDPFEYTSHCIMVVIEGEVVSDVIR